MPRRIEIELTSDRQDGSWTWRAAGAKQPKGVVPSDLLYPGARVGDVVRAEADFGIEGINVLSVIAPGRAEAPRAERLEIKGQKEFEGGVTSSLVPKSDRPRPPRRDGDRPERTDRPRRDGDRPGPRPDRGPRRDGAPSASGPAGTGGQTGTSGPTGTSGSRPRRDGAPAGGSPDRPRRDGFDRPRRDSVDRPARPPRPPEAEAAKSKRLTPASTHRDAVLESLSPEERVVAEQVLRGGIPAVRQAIEAQNRELKAGGSAEVSPGPLLKLAEDLLPRLKAAEWRDRADAAIAIVDDRALRDLRSVAAGADAARDDEARLLGAQLREALERRVNQQRERWVTDITAALDEERLVRALHLSSRPPDPATRFPSELAMRLAEAASAAMTPDALNDRWMTLLEAVAESPVRRSVKPLGLPTEATEKVKQAAAQASGRIPALAAMLGIAMPPPPGPGRRPLPPKPKPKPKPAQDPRPAEPAEAEPVEAAAVEAKPAGAEPVEAAAVEAAAVEAAAVEAEPAEAAAVEAKPAETAAVEAKPAEAAAVEAEPAEAAAVEAEPAEAAAVEAEPAEAAAVEAAAVEAKPVEAGALEAAAVEAEPAESPAVEAETAEAETAEADSPGGNDSGSVDAATVVTEPAPDVAAPEAVVAAAPVEAAPVDGAVTNAAEPEST